MVMGHREGESRWCVICRSLVVYFGEWLRDVQMLPLNSLFSSSFPSVTELNATVYSTKALDSSNNKKLNF